jgi:hypothetical protein
MVQAVASRIVLDERVFENNFKVMHLVSRIPKWLRRMAKIFCGLTIFYVLIYIVLSVNGRYSIAEADIGRLEGFSWAPAGLFLENEENWDCFTFYAFYPLWAIDCRHFHTGIETYITDDQVNYWMNQRQPNDFIHLARQLPPTVPIHFIVGTLGNPSRTNSLANGSIRWEYDYQNTNGVAFGSLFFNRHGVFEGSSTNANAQTADLN